MATLLDGSATAREIRAEIAAQCQHLERETGVRPRLDVILVGEDPASVTYVRMKQKACAAAGMGSEIHALPPDASQTQVLDLVANLNNNIHVHGVLVQHPVPAHLNEQEILDAVHPAKDVDGISSESLGRLLTGIRGFRPCTPKGIVRLLDRYGVPLKGKTAVVIGRSIILGKPAALLLIERHATVTICHSRTQNLDEICRSADILVAAIGKAEFVKGGWVKPGACVVDAGYNRVGGKEHDVGDVDFAAASERAAWITPVPGGVGPMTIAMLMENTIEAARLAAGVRDTA